MTGSSPEDVAVAFRTFPRRLSALLASAEDDAARTAAGPLTQQLDDLIRGTARSFGLAADGDLPSLTSRLAQAIDDRPADQWTPERLDEVRAAALEGGHLLRQIEATLNR